MNSASSSENQNSQVIQLRRVLFAVIGLNLVILIAGAAQMMNPIFLTADKFTVLDKAGQPVTILDQDGNVKVGGNLTVDGKLVVSGGLSFFGKGNHGDTINLPNGTKADDWYIVLIPTCVGGNPAKYEHPNAALHPYGPFGSEIFVQDDALLWYEVKAEADPNGKSFKIVAQYRYKWNTNPGADVHKGKTTILPDGTGPLLAMEDVQYLLIRK